MHFIFELAFEGFLERAYLDFQGDITIGYGRSENIKLGWTINQDDAEILLKEDLLSSESSVSSLVEVDLNDNQFSALVAFVHAVGEQAFSNSTLLRLLNQGNYQATADQFTRWNRLGGQVHPGLTRRREAEKELFLKAL